MPARANGKRWTTEYQELGTGPLPVESYVSPEYFEREREKIFKHTWLCTGKRTEEIPQAGDYVDRSRVVATGRTSSKDL